MIAEPYPRLIVSRDQVNQELLSFSCRSQLPARLGIAEERWVFLLGHADLHEPPLLRRPDLSRSPAAVLASEAALEMAGLSMSEGIDNRPVQLLPDSGLQHRGRIRLGAGRSARTDAIGRAALLRRSGQQLLDARDRRNALDRARSAPGSYGFIGANGGTLSKYSVRDLLDHASSVAPGPQRRAAGRAGREADRGGRAPPGGAGDD